MVKPYRIRRLSPGELAVPLWFDTERGRPQDGTAHPPPVAQPFLRTPGRALQPLAAEIRAASFLGARLECDVQSGLTGSFFGNLFPRSKDIYIE